MNTTVSLTSKLQNSHIMDRSMFIVHYCTVNAGFEPKQQVEEGK